MKTDVTETIERTPTIEAWGSLAEPIHLDAAGASDPVWKDNAFLAFWDLRRQVFGSVHVSTSPNGAGARRARVSVVVGEGRPAEVVEDLEPGRFASKSISFGMDGLITVKHPRLTGQLVNTPLLRPADYSTTDLIPPLVPGRPLQHFQQSCDVRGMLSVDGRQVEVDAVGLRDRTWGFRNEAAQWVEYAAIVGVFDGLFVTAMKFLSADGSMKSDGFVVSADATRAVTDLRLRRTAAALFVAASLTLDDGPTRTISVVERHGGIFVPMGAETDGPAFGAYDDFMTLTCDGQLGGGFCEQGIIHRVH